MKESGNKILFLFTAILLLGLPLATEAYIDPGTGSFIIQTIVAGVFSAGVVIKMYWQKIMAYFGKEKIQPDQKEENLDKAE
jgi:hypothetical protein